VNNLLDIKTPPKRRRRPSRPTTALPTSVSRTSGRSTGTFRRRPSTRRSSSGARRGSPTRGRSSSTRESTRPEPRTTSSSSARRTPRETSGGASTPSVRSREVRRAVRPVAGIPAGEGLFVQDCFGGADPDFRLPVRIVTEQAWHSLFARNMFLKPKTHDEYRRHVPEFTVLCVPDFKAFPPVDQTPSETFIVLTSPAVSASSGTPDTRERSRSRSSRS